MQLEEVLSQCKAQSPLSGHLLKRAYHCNCVALAAQQVSLGPDSPPLEMEFPWGPASRSTSRPQTLSLLTFHRNFWLPSLILPFKHPKSWNGVWLFLPLSVVTE